MTRDEGFAIKLLSPPTGESEPACRLFYQGKDTGRVLSGAILEDCFRIDGGWLLFLTYDVPFEEALEICLLGPNFELLDRATLAAPNATANFSDPKILSGQRLQFNFLGAMPWRLDLLTAPGFRLPFFSEPLGVTRPFGFSRRFALSHNTT